MRILIIEDEKAMAMTVKDELRHTYAVDVCNSGKDGSYQARVNEYDAIILDLTLPDMTGIEVCRSIRQDDVTTPILVLTGRNETESKIHALDAGADDYLTKPFSFNELKARIRALLRRSPHGQLNNKLLLGDLILDTANRTVRRADQDITLRRKEFDLLEYLLRNKNRVVTRSMILEHVWDNNVDFFTNAIDVHIKYLRDRIDRPFDRKLIKTVHGLGYKIQETI